jgi:hypothetical protein
MIQAFPPALDTLEKRHWYGLHTGSRLTSHFRRTREPMATDVTPERVIESLHQAGMRCVLMGTHAINTWREEPRATQDVDVLVRKRDILRAVRALSEVFPELDVRDYPDVARFVDPATGKGVLDVMKPTQEVFHMVFRHTIAVGETHEIPNLEVTLVSIFAAMVSPRRLPERKLTDGGDFTQVVRYNRDHIDLVKLKRLADKVYSAGGEEIMEMIKDIDAGRIIRL